MIIDIREIESNRWLRRGIALLDDEAYEAALNAFRRAHESNPDSVDAIHYLAQELYMQGDAAEAEKLLRRGLEIKPTVGVYRTLAAIILDNPKRIEEIPQIIAAVREKLGDQKNADLIEGHYELEKNNGAAAAEFFRRALDADPENGEAAEGLSRALNLIGIDLSEAGNNEEAIFTFKKAIDLDPYCSAPQVNIGNCFCALGRLERARRAYEIGIELDPDNPQAHFNLARLLVDESRYEDAEAEFLEVLRIDPEYPDAHAELGRLFSLQGRFERAIDHYEKELELNPDCTPCMSNLAIALICIGRVAEGEGLLKKALSIEEDPFTLYTLGGLYASLNRDADSLAMLERAASHRPAWLFEYLRSDEKFNNIRSNPRFTAVLKFLADASS